VQNTQQSVLKIEAPVFNTRSSVLKFGEWRMEKENEVWRIENEYWVVVDKVNPKNKKNPDLGPGFTFQDSRLLRLL